MDAPSGPFVFTARPRPARPRLVSLSSASLLVLVGAALAQRSYAFGLLLVVAAAVPWSEREWQRALGAALAFLGALLGALGIFLVPLSARVTALYGPGIAIFALRALALGGESARRYSDRRWGRGTTAKVIELNDALAAALASRRASPDDIDKAVVAIAAAGAPSVPEDEMERRAFWINVYNVLAQHAGRGRRSRRAWDVLEIYRTTYEVAGTRLSLDDIEHGLLRDGAPSPAAPWVKMDPADPRRRFAVRLDPRVHFALNCGALSCPPLRVYRGADLDASLEGATKAFLASETRVDEARRVITTTKLLSWYAKDFGGRAGVFSYLSRALDADEARLRAMSIRYHAYDFTNAVVGTGLPSRP